MTNLYRKKNGHNFTKKHRNNNFKSRKRFKKTRGGASLMEKAKAKAKALEEKGKSIDTGALAKKAKEAATKGANIAKGAAASAIEKVKNIDTDALKKKAGDAAKKGMNIAKGATAAAIEKAKSIDTGALKDKAKGLATKGLSMASGLASSALAKAASISGDGAGSSGEESGQPVTQLIGETFAQGARAGMILFKESIGAFISVMANLSASARNRMRKRYDQFKLNTTRKLGNNMNFGQIRNNMAKFASNKANQLQNKINNGMMIPGQMGVNGQPMGVNGQPMGVNGLPMGVNGLPMGVNAPQMDANGQPMGVNAQQMDANGQPMVVNAPQMDANGQPIPPVLEIDNSDEWFKLIRKHYIINGEIVTSMALSELKTRRENDWERFNDDPKSNKHLITFTIDQKNAKKYIVQIKQCVGEKCDDGKIVIPKKGMFGRVVESGGIELYKTYQRNNGVVSKLLEILDYDKLSDCIASTPSKSITFHEDIKNKKNGQSETFSIRDIKQNYKYKFIPCIPIKSFANIKESFKTTDFHSSDNNNCTKEDFDKFLKVWKKNGETMETKFMENMKDKSSAPLMLRMVCIKSSDEKEWNKQEKAGDSAEQEKNKSEKNIKSRGNILRRLTGTETKSQKLEANIKKAEKELAKAEKENNIDLKNKLEKELDTLKGEQDELIDEKKSQIDKTSVEKKTKIAAKDAEKITSKNRSNIFMRKWEGGDYPLHHLVSKKNGDKTDLEKILDVVDKKTGKKKYDINEQMGKKKETVLHQAILSKNKEKLANIKFLISKNADINLTNKKGQTPLDLAIEKKEFDIRKFLESKSAKKGGKRKKYTRRKRKRKNIKKNTRRHKYTRRKKH